MAAPDGDVEQLLASRTATPITQLKPDLADQATRKIHGEVTVTWPYSSFSKRLAFLLAEPDFRLRREKGQVRIVLNGPSAEAIGSWELGSGDEVTLALDGVEWATDEEPARPPGSRLDWQLRFAGKLTLKATLGETQETRSINIDQPLQADPIQMPEPDQVPEPVQAPEPAQFAETDTALFDDEPLAAKGHSLSTTNEYASPIFVKRSRASYGPLFEFNIDGELEEDGGRRNKGRKRPRYSVQNGRWRYREESDSPEPDILEEESSPTPEQDDDVIMQDTPSKPQMADGACQTEESDLLPPPQSAENTPSKGWNKTEPLFAFGNKVLGETDSAVVDTGVQASPPKEKITVPNDHQEEQQRPAAASAPTTNPFGFAPGQSRFQIDSGVRAGFGVSQAGTSANVPTNPQLQASSLFGTGPAPIQPMFGQPSNIGAGFGAFGDSSVDSVRFGFGQPPQPTFGGMQSAPSMQAPQYYDAHYYSASYPEPQQSDRVSPALHYTSGEPTQNGQRDEELETTVIDVHPDQVASHEVPLWPIASQNLDSSNAVGHLNAPEELRSDGSLAEETPPGMIPPAVEDGTRNRDEMREEGLLSEPVFEQGVSRQALPHGRQESADEDEESMDSDEQADYDEDEKGDDYDMRNYDRVSDDDEGSDGEEEDVPDGEMLDDDGEDYYEDEEEYDEEDDYEEDDYAHPASYQQPPQPATQPAVQKAPVVIDLLSDSDDEEEEEAPQAPPPPRSDIERHQMDGIATPEPQYDRSGGLAKENSPEPASPEQQSTEAERRQELEEDLEQELEEQIDDDAEESSSHDERDSEGETFSEYEDDGTAGEGSEVGGDEPGNIEILEDLDTIRDHVAVDKNAVVPEVEEALSSPLRPHEHLASEADVSEEVFQVEEMMVDVAGAAQQQAIPGDAMSEDGGPQDDVVDDSIQIQSNGLAATIQSKSEIFSASLHAQPQQSIEDSDMDEDRGSNDSMVESFQTQSGNFSASFQTQTADMAMPDLAASSPDIKPSQEGFDEDVVMDDVPRDATVSYDQVIVQQEEAGEADVGDTMMQVSPKEDADLVNESEGGDEEHMTTEPQAQEDSEMTEAKAASDGEIERDAGSIEDEDSTSVDQAQVDEEEHQALPETGSEPLADEVVAASSPFQQEAEPVVEQAAEVSEEAPHTPSIGSEDFQDASELPQMDEPHGKVHNDDHSSFMTADSQASETRNTEKTGPSPIPTPKRKGRKHKQDSGVQLAASAIASSKGQHVSSEQPPSPRTTRKKTMSFQKAHSRQNSHEDMSIQLARAALKSPSRNKASAKSANKVESDLVTRLGNDMPDCAPLKDLKSYNQNNLDVAAVATSEPSPPKRTKTRQYATCFTVTDPSIAPDGVIEVSLFRAHKDYLPIVKPGDSILLRGFTVTALPNRGFGLQTHPEESSWAVFDTDGEDALPQIRGPPVELNDEETGYLTDLRGWYAALDEGMKGKLAKAAGDMVEKGRESRGEN